MANVLVVVELKRGRALPVCLEALGQARRVSSELGATLYAVVPVARAPRYGEDDLIAVLAKHGADKVVLVTDEVLAATADSLRWGTHGAALGAATDLLPPSLMLFGDTPGSREVAPRVAARMGAALLIDAWIEVRRERLALWEGSGEQALGLEGDLEFPVVAVVPPGRYDAAVGGDEAEVEILPASGQAPDFEELGWEADPSARPVVLSAGSSSDVATLLGAALGAAVVAQGTVSGARLVVAIGCSPGPAGAAAERRVVLGRAARTCECDYAVEGDPAELARQLAAAIAETP